MSLRQTKKKQQTPASVWRFLGLTGIFCLTDIFCVRSLSWWRVAVLSDKRVGSGVDSPRPPSVAVGHDRQSVKRIADHKNTAMAIQLMIELSAQWANSSPSDDKTTAGPTPPSLLSIIPERWSSLQDGAEFNEKQAQYRRRCSLLFFLHYHFGDELQDPSHQSLVIKSLLDNTASSQ